MPNGMYGGVRGEIKSPLLDYAVIKEENVNDFTEKPNLLIEGVKFSVSMGKNLL